MKRAILISGCAALALGACSKKADTAATTGGSAPTAAAAPAPAPVMPTRKPGLWEQAVDVGGVKHTISMCVDEASEAKVKWWSTERSAGSSDCSEQRVTPTAGGWSFHSVCQHGDGGTVTADGVATGEFGTHLKIDVTSVTTGASMPQANGTHKVSMESTWKGPCPTGMKGGDIAMADGMRVSTVGGAPQVTTGPGGVDMAKLRAQAMSGHIDPAEIAKMRAQAKAMEAAAK
jgi:hypothetical protein